MLAAAIKGILVIFFIWEFFYFLEIYSGLSTAWNLISSLGVTGFLIATIYGFIIVPIIKKHENYLESLLNRANNFMHRLLSPVSRWWRELSDKKEALSRDEIKQLKIVHKLCFIKSFEVDDLIDTFEKNNLIKKTKVKGAIKKTYLFDSDMFFSPAENKIKNKLFASFFDKCCNLDFQGIAILSRDGADYNRIFHKTGIEQKTKIKNATVETIHLNDTIIKIINPFSNLQKGDKVIIMQLWDEKDDFLKKAYKYINDNSLAKVVGTFTLFSSNLSGTTKIGNGIKEVRFIKLKMP